MKVGIVLTFVFFCSLASAQIDSSPAPGMSAVPPSHESAPQFLGSAANCQLSTQIESVTSNCIDVHVGNGEKPVQFDGSSATRYPSLISPAIKFKRVVVSGGIKQFCEPIPDYAKRQPWNSDNSKLLLFVNSRGGPCISSGGYWLFDAKTYARVSTTPGVIYDGIDAEPTWDRASPRIFYYRSGMKLYSYDIEKNRSNVVHDFSRIAGCGTCVRIRNGDEGNPDDAQRYWAYWAENASYEPVRIIVYDKQTDTVVSNRDVNDLNNPKGGRDHDGVCKGGCVDWIGMSHSGNYVVVAWAFGNTSNITAGNGNWVYDRSLTSGRQVCVGSSGHTDPAQLADGTDVYVGFCSEHDGLNGYHDINVVRMTDGKTLHHFIIDQSVATTSWHMSARNNNRPGWVLYSWYIDGIARTGPGIFSLEINALNLDTGEVRRIVHNQSIRNNDYFAEPHAVVNLDFTKILWGSNWRNSGGPVDTYEADLP
jgi:hypothetical protein